MLMRTPSEIAKKYYWDNREKILKQNKTPKKRAYKAAWARNNRKINPDRVRKYNNKRMKFRRNKWISENGPCNKCGSISRLEVDHINPSTKISHRVWSFGKKRMLDELKKCQVLCFLCHRLKTNIERGWKIHGEIKWQKGCRCNECIRVHNKKIRKLNRENILE